MHHLNVRKKCEKNLQKYNKVKKKEADLDMKCNTLHHHMSEQYLLLNNFDLFINCFRFEAIVDGVW